MVKKLILVVTVSLAIFGFSYLACAEEGAPAATTDLSAQMPAEVKMPVEMMSPEKKEWMHHKAGMMKSMMNKEIVATQDGGVVVLAGKKLIKYDKDLNLVKEVEINIDSEYMHKMMKDCPMKKMMQGDTPEESASTEEAKAVE